MFRRLQVLTESLYCLIFLNDAAYLNYLQIIGLEVLVLHIDKKII